MLKTARLFPIAAAVAVVAGCGAAPGASTGAAAAANTTTRSTPASTPPTTPAPAARTDPAGRVTKVVDGDTVKVLDPTLGAVTVRVLGIDTPQTKKPGFTVGCFGPEASANATRLLGGQKVTVTRDPGQDATDRYGRTLAYLTLPDGSDYSVAAARGGYAKSYVYDHRPVTKHAEIAAAEKAAQLGKVGLWGPPCNGATASVAPPSPPPAPAPADPVPTESSSGGGAGRPTSYSSCAEARAAGATPLHRSQLGHSAKLDHNDGVACR